MKKVLDNFIVRIVLASLFIIIIPVAVNKLLLKEAFSWLITDDDINRACRGILSGLILAPLMYIWFYFRFYREKMYELEMKNVIPGLVWGAGLAVAILLPVIMALRITGIISLIQAVRPEQFWYGLAMILVLAVTEELFFRGILYRIIEARFSCPVAIIVTAILFTAAHMTNDNFTIVSVLSVVSGSVILGLLFTWGRSLWMPVFFHVTWNMIQVIAGLPVSGLSLFSGAALFRVNIQGPEWITGGDFGLENSLIVIFMLAVAGIYVGCRIRRAHASMP